ncbi:hypothetical protein P8452_04965 [Trifolium repens]|nr:hypothetical protein P8452_04965 [Trifolium repens]
MLEPTSPSLHPLKSIVLHFRPRTGLHTQPTLASHYTELPLPLVTTAATTLCFESLSEIKGDKHKLIRKIKIQGYCFNSYSSWGCSVCLFLVVPAIADKEVQAHK